MVFFIISVLFLPLSFASWSIIPFENYFSFSPRRFTNLTYIFSFDSSMSTVPPTYGKIRTFFIKVGTFKQTIYNRVTLVLLRIPIIRHIVIYSHLCLFYFKDITHYKYENKLTTLELNLAGLLISLICSRLHIAGYFIIFCLLLIRLDFAAIFMLRFYKTHEDILHRNFPKIKNPPNSRGMWSRAANTINEAAANSKVQTIAVAVAGAVAWKALDVWDTHNQGIIAQADRESAERTADKDRESAERTADIDRESVERTANKDREEARLSREQAERHHQDNLKINTNSTYF